MRTIRALIELGPEVVRRPADAMPACELNAKPKADAATQTMRHARKRGEAYQKWARSGGMR